MTLMLLWASWYPDDTGPRAAPCLGRNQEGHCSLEGNCRRIIQGHLYVLKCSPRLADFRRHPNLQEGPKGLLPKVSLEKALDNAAVSRAPTWQVVPG